MKITPESYEVLSTQEKVIWYKVHFVHFKRTKATSLWYDILLKDLMYKTYMLPQKTKIIPKSEVSGFLLYIMDSFENLVDSYTPDNGSWDSFFTSFMINRFFNYKRCNLLKKRKEEIILNSHMSFEYSLRQIDQDNETYSVSDTAQQPVDLPAEKLIFIFKKNELARKKFFIFLLSSSPSLTDDLICRICNLFNIDLRQTRFLVSKVLSQEELEKTIERKDSLEARRNYNYSQALFAESSYPSFMSESYQEAVHRHDLNMERLNQRNLDLSKMIRNASQSKISTLLNLQRGTVSSSQTVIKKIILYCVSPNVPPPADILTEEIRNKLVNGTWKQEINKLVPLSKFYPFKVFRIE